MGTSHLLFIFTMLLSVSTSTPTPLVLPLTHSLSTTNFTSTHHLLKSTSTRSATRFLHHHLRRHLQSQQVSLPLSAGSDYTLSLTLNSIPPQSISLFMDTGSDLVWFPCHPFQCILCDDKQPPNSSTVAVTGVPSAAKKIHCKSPSCAAAHSSLSSSDLCAISGCPLVDIETSDCSSSACPPFYFAYGDGSLTATLYSGSVSLYPPLTLTNFTFGCSHSALAEPTGVAGFGPGLLSLPAQLSSTRFSYCFISHSFDSSRFSLPSPLILGRYEENSVNVTAPLRFSYTPLLNNPKHPYFYSVGLEGISVGGRNIPGPGLLKKVDNDGSGGFVVDSGTTFTMLPSGFYNKVVRVFDGIVGRAFDRAKAVEESTGLGPCYYNKGGVLEVPGIVLRFSGSSVALPRRNYFYEFVDESDAKMRKKVGCLMLMNGGDERELKGGPGGILGNYQQQGFEVVYDLEEKRVGFARRQCASLWQSLNKGRH